MAEPEAFVRNTHNSNVLWEEIKNVVERAVNSAYGTDPRHSLLARAVADEVAFGHPIPWSLAGHFGQVSLPTHRLPEGLCPDKTDHEPHEHDSAAFGKIWCHADQTRRQPYAGEQMQRARSGS